MTETLCDLDWVRAEYEPARPAVKSSGARFSITVTAPGSVPQTFSVQEKDGDQFVAELDVLTAIIRAKVMRSRLIGWAAVGQAR